MTTPLVSIVMPVHNAEKFILDALTSLLVQSYQAIEVLVVNDYSNDRSMQLVEGCLDQRIRLLSNINRGAVSAMNMGLAKARGEVIMFCDADDTYPVNRIEQQVAWLEKNSNYDAVCG